LNQLIFGGKYVNPPKNQLVLRGIHVGEGMIRLRFLVRQAGLNALIDRFAAKQQAARRQNQAAHQHEFGFAAGVGQLAFARRDGRIGC